MAARTQADDAVFRSGSVRGVTPPLLPTLMMAAILGAASYLCHEPAAVAVPAPRLATAVAAAPEATAEVPFVPAPLAFRTQFPLNLPFPPQAVAQAEPVPAAPAYKAAARTPAARATLPRHAEAPRVLARARPATDKAPPAPDRTPSASDRPLPFAAEGEDAPTTVAASDDGLLPAIALPFAPTLRAVTQAGAAAGAFVGAKGAVLGAETASLGAAVSGWVGRMR